LKYTALTAEDRQKTAKLFLSGGFWPFFYFRRTAAIKNHGFSARCAGLRQRNKKPAGKHCRRVDILLRQNGGN